jgi:hypothetical protein
MLGMPYSYDRAVSRTAAAADALYMKELTVKARNKIWELDEKFIGTDDYMGVAYFWHDEYKWWLRDASQKIRRKVHKAFRDARLTPDESSAEHRAIIGKFFPDALQRLKDMDET